MRRFALEDYSDRELVHLVNDLQDEEGWTHPQAIAVQVGIGKKHVRNVVIRLAWMRRYGIVEKNGKKTPALWRLTEAGEEMVRGSNLAKGKLTMLDELKDHEIVWASHALASRFQAAAITHAVMTRREWQREIKRRGRR